MALLRDKVGQIVHTTKDGRTVGVKITTEGEIKARTLREERAEKKHETALKNYTQRLLRSPQQQLQVLNERLGRNVGAKKERERLKALLKT